MIWMATIGWNTHAISYNIIQYHLEDAEDDSEDDDSGWYWMILDGASSNWVVYKWNSGSEKDLENASRGNKEIV